MTDVLQEVDELQDELGDSVGENQRLCALIREAYEAWRGSGLPQNPQAETAPEAYAYKIINDMLEPIRKALK